MEVKINTDCPLISNSFVTCYTDYLRIHLYYFPFGSKKVKYCEIRSCELLPMNDLGLFESKLWGMSLSPIWWPCDMNRLGRNNYILLDANQWPKIGLTMDDNDTFSVYHLIRAKINENSSDNTQKSSLGKMEEKTFFKSNAIK